MVVSVSGQIPFYGEIDIIYGSDTLKFEVVGSKYQVYSDSLLIREIDTMYFLRGDSVYFFEVKNDTLFVNNDTIASSGGGAGPWTKSGNYVFPSTIGDSVGIGTEDPATLLDVAGKITTGNDALNISGRINFISSGGDLSHILTNISDELQFNDAVNYNFDNPIRLAGNKALYLDGGGQETYIVESSDHIFDIYAGGKNMIKVVEATTDVIQFLGDSVSNRGHQYIEGTLDFGGGALLDNVTNANQLIITEDSTKVVGDFLIEDPTPTISVIDNSGADDDVNFRITTNLVTTGSGAEDAEITFMHQINGAEVDFLTATQTILNISSTGNFQFEPDLGNIWFTSSVSNTPELLMTSNSDDATSAILHFYQNRSTETDEDVAGTIKFSADDDGGNQLTTSTIISRLEEVDDGEEWALLQFDIWDESDGTGQLEDFLSMTGGNSVGLVQAVIEFNAGQKDIDFEINMNAASALYITAATGATDVINALTAGSVISDGVVTSTTHLGNVAQQTITLGVGVTTFAVTTNVIRVTGDGGANTIATITGASVGTYAFIFVDGLVTISNDDGHGANTTDLEGAGDFTSADDSVLVLVFDGTSWYQSGESVN